ncbi:MAG: hypothetical protein GX678_01445 [Actinomycetales bacterium]|nr:hypothetical protein [Actinomycetales bacterium]
MARSRLLTAEAFAEVCARIDAGTAERADLKQATWHLLELLAVKAPGNSVEVRVPPFAAVQVIAGARHKRGTPPAVVELDAATWIALARGDIAWADARVNASGERSDLSALLPLAPRAGADSTPTGVGP